MALTPRQLAAYLEFSVELDREQRADDLFITAVAAQGDHNIIEKTLKELNGG
jgi:hypothetical protein